MAWRLAALVILAGAAPSDPRPTPAGPTIRLAVEVDWSVAARPGPEADHAVSSPSTAQMTLSSGRIAAVAAWPPGSAAGGEVQAKPDGSWSIGRGAKGRVRALLEAPLGAELTVKVADRSVLVPLASILDGPQRTTPPSGFEVGVERLPWDSIRADFEGDSADGSAEPGALVPLSVAFNVLTPEAATINLRCSAELRPARGGEPLWRQEWQEVVETDSATPRPHALNLTAPGAEGTYVLEIKTAWEPLADGAGSRLGRWIKRRRNPSQTTSASRRLTLAVVTPQPPAAPTPAKSEGSEGVEADAFDLARGLGHRSAATGRGLPTPRDVEPGRSPRPPWRTWPAASASSTESAGGPPSRRPWARATPTAWPGRPSPSRSRTPSARIA